MFKRAFHLSHFISKNGGTCLEFGVFQGDTYSYQAQQILTKYINSTLIGFDSWRGLPEESPGIWTPERHAAGEFAASRSDVQEKLALLGVERNDKRFRLIDGFFADSLTSELRDEIRDVIFINVDVDLYRSTLELLDFVKPLLRPGVVIYWDDWKDPQDECTEAWGEHLAWSEWYPKQNGLEVETIEVNPVNQRIMVATQVSGRKLCPPLPSMSDIRRHAYELAAIAEGPSQSGPGRRCHPGVKDFAKCVNLLKLPTRVIRGIVRRLTRPT